MTRAIASRLRRIEGAFGWKLTTLRGPDGRELTVPTGLVVDAWLRVVLDADVPNLPPEVSRFIATARMRQGDGEVLLALRNACRDVWFPDRRRSIEQRDDEELPDPPAPGVVAPRRRDGSSRGRSE